MIVLITGICGFVGPYLERCLLEKGHIVFGTSRIKRSNPNYFSLDLTCEQDIISLLNRLKPTCIFHLAGISNVKQSWNLKKETFEANTISTINLLEAVKKVDQNIRVITIGSSEEYGYLNHTSIQENAPLKPVNPYGASKAAVSMLAQQYYNADNLDIVHTRPFNHIGPGQKQGFVTTDFAYQIALINSIYKHNKKTMKIGKLDAIRDFTDVRDVVDAYYKVALQGSAGQTYNICSGQGVEIKKILEILLSFSKKRITIKENESLMKGIEVPIMIGNNDKIVTELNWSPQITLEQSLYNIYQYWVNKINSNP
ncbi:GDP-4-dehydro-6-deoxy-D-mannose reductase [Bacillus tianshenii]|uniref:GDP-4-dehydro-6-deoxy-D-mannose reductase n=1 Tax=Sutcliffiella tianshenii TaxID=1463404 RepID=A0ABS2P536_9BACI|nr:GDP-mannose 4,6-dehydratase [Bacillus tianshenii]MBM7622075.1 GDP-4-dehydro-6-deoxy-D-mannose reductase [Bacillus tianshenii]